MVEFIIDPEFRDKIPAMPQEDFDGLRADIIRDGYDGKFNEQNLIRRLSKHAPIEIIRNGRTSLCKGDTKWAWEILAVYNSGTSTNRLPDLFA